MPEYPAESFSSNEALQEEVERLRAENVKLTRQLQAAMTGSNAERESCRAALNLMEDAIAARSAEQRENAERRRAEQQLVDANRRKDEFLAMLAHELRNPLAPIRNGLQILRLAGFEKTSAERLGGMLDRQVSHLVRLVDDLMEVSRITRGRIELHKEPIELAEVVQTALDSSRSYVEAGRHQLSVNMPDDPLLVEGDAIRLVQVLTNLLNNAAKYTEPGGNITLSAWRAESEVAISVKDTGVGISEDMISKVFDLFTQVDRATNRSQGGLGIGLTLVRTLVELHGGRVVASSDGIGQGSEFVVWLPLAAKESAAQYSTAQICWEPTAVSRRILVVDDNRDAADSLGALLKLLGAEVAVVHDGYMALEAIESFRPSVVLMDIGMPGLDGIEVARRARQRPEGCEATLIALTGWGQEEDRRRSKAAGFDHHLVKPVELSTLQALFSSLPAEAEMLQAAGAL